MTSLPKLVRQRMAASPRPAEHPATELLAAFSEDSIGKVARLAVLEHLSQCSDCRQVIFLAQPELELDPVVTSTTNRGWVRLPAFRWALAAACVVIVGGAALLVKEQVGQSAGELSAEKVIATQRVETQTAEPSTASTEVKQTSDSQPAINSGPPPDKIVAHVTPAKNPESEVDSLRNPAPASSNAPTQRMAEAQPQIAGAEGFASLGPTPYTAVQSSNLPRWTLTSGGTLERSLDSGKTWQKVAIEGNKAKLYAVSASGPRIWVGGSGGALYNSTDAGRNWLRIIPATNGTELKSDVIGIEFASSLNGQLRTSSGKIWTTSDGGQRWEEK